MKEKLNSIICELENINDGISNQESYVENQVRDIEYSIGNLNDVSSDLYDLRTQVNNLQNDMHELSKELDGYEKGTSFYTKDEVKQIVANCIQSFRKSLSELLDKNIISIEYLIDTELANYSNSQTNERDEL